MYIHLYLPSDWKGRLMTMLLISHEFCKLFRYDPDEKQFYLLPTETITSIAFPVNFIDGVLMIIRISASDSVIHTIMTCGIN